MSSFVITRESSYSPLFWCNTLLPQGIDINQYKAEVNVGDAGFDKFVTKIAANDMSDLKCWMISSDLDFFWINETARDRRVYYVRAGFFEQVSILNEPDKSLDLYLAHLVEKTPGAFDFEPYLSRLV